MGKKELSELQMNALYMKLDISFAYNYSMVWGVICVKSTKGMCICQCTMCNVYNNVSACTCMTCYYYKSNVDAYVPHIHVPVHA